jgi:2-polyprenyl-6-methoxyphenol hydroxylase-like FAD-dependent oxidoreductase
MIDILVVGAGPTGLLMAAEAARFGMSCRIVDLLAVPLKYSRALAIQPRTLELFDHLGIVDRFLARGLKVRGVNPCTSQHRLAHFSFKKIDSDYPFVLSLEQNETEKILTEYLFSFGIEIEREVELVDLKQDRDRIFASLRHLRTGKEEKMEASYAVGCDGAHSFVRKQIGFPFMGTAFPSIFSLADVRLDWNRPQDELFLFLNSQGILGVIPMPGKKRFRLVFQLPRCQKCTEEQILEAPTLEEIQKRVEETIGKDATVSDPLWMANFHIHSRLVESYRKGRVFLAGDAAHIHSPAGGQGMNSGLQDAFNLGWKLASGQEDLIATYSLERHLWGQKLVRATRLGTRLATLRNPAAVCMRNWAIHTFAPHFERKILRAMGQISIHYSKSCIVKESGGLSGGPKAGTRAPNAPVGNSNLYALFRKTNDWHLLLFGNSSLFQKKGIRVHSIQDERAKAIYGVKDRGFYLIRPDQYIADRGKDYLF